MSTPEKASGGALAVCIALGVLTLLLYILAIVLLTSLTGSDAAGNAYSQAFAAISIIMVWLLLALMTLIAVLKGSVPVPAIIAAAMLIPASGFVSMEVLELLSDPRQSLYFWPIIIPAGIPPLVVAFSLWALLPGLRTRLPARVAASVMLGAIFLLSAAIVPFDAMRAYDIEQSDLAHQKVDAAYAALPPDAPLWDLLPFMAASYGDRETELRKRVRTRATRQSEAETMLVRGDFPLLYLGSLDLEPTPSLCEKARGQLRRQVAPLVLRNGESKPYSAIAQLVTGAVAAMNWLVGYDCSCDAESRAWETMAKAYTDTNFDVIELARLRDPRELGRILRETPERFSMLTPKAHLKAWLKFADEAEYRDKALDGARKLDHRTSDAIAMLRDKSDISAPWQALKYMPELDLEPTPGLCTAALTVLRSEFAKTARPPADDPRPYRELLARLGAFEPLKALQWAAGRGCDAEPELKMAEDLIGSYQDSFDRQRMLRQLAALRRRH